MEFNFEAVETGSRWLGIPPDCIRINSTYISLGSGVAEHFKSQTTNFEDKLNLSFEVDVVNRAMRVTPKEDPIDGYTFSEEANRFKGAIPSHLKRKGLPRGDYKQLPEMPNVFVWQDPETAYKAPTAAPAAGNANTVEIGDRVSWYVKPRKDKGNPGITAEGRVISLSEGVLGGMSPDVEPIAQIMVDSPEYKEWFPGKFQVNVKVKNLTIVKKQ